LSASMTAAHGGAHDAEHYSQLSPWRVFCLATSGSLLWASIIASATPRLSLDHATACQHRRPGRNEDAAVIRRDHTWPRRSARPMLSLPGCRLGGVMEGYLLWVVATSARLPILYGRCRPLSGARPTGTYRCRATRQPST